MDQAAVAAGQTTLSFLDWVSSPITQVMLIPLLGCLIISLIPPSRLLAIRWVALLSALLSCGCSVMMLTGAGALVNQGIQVGDKQWFPLAQYSQFKPDFEGIQLPQQFHWMSIRFGELQSFSVDYNVGIDGLSLPLVLLCTIILVMVVLWAWPRTERAKEFFALTLFMQVGLLGSFVALDYVLLYLFWEWMLIPMFFLIAGWGKDREKATRAAIKFFIYTLAGSVFMLIAFIALQVWSAGQVYTFSIPGLMSYSLAQGVQAMPVSARVLMFLGLLMGFAVKAPMWPLHTWLPDAHSEAPTEMSVILAALMLKSGTYMYLRALYTTFPDICYIAGPFVAFCGVAGIVYGAGVTLLQTDLKRLVAWSSISHMGFIVLGISAMNPSSTLGAMFHMVGHGVVIALLFFLVGWIEQRYGTRDIRELAVRWGAAPSPWAGGLLTLAAFAGMGFPGLIGFPGELFTLQGTYFNNPQWFTVQVPSLSGLLRFWGSVLTDSDSFLYSQRWFTSTITGQTGARFLEWCAAFAVLGILTSMVYMLNMLMRVVYARRDGAEQPQEALTAAAQPLPEGELQRPALTPALAIVGTGSGGAMASVEDSDNLAPQAPPAPRRSGPLQLWGFDWNYGLVLLPLAAAVVVFGVYPQPLITMFNKWAILLGAMQLGY